MKVMTIVHIKYFSSLFIYCITELQELLLCAMENSPNNGYSIFIRTVFYLYENFIKENKRVGCPFS